MAPTMVRASVRSVVLAPASGAPIAATVRATREGPAGSDPFRLWPDGAPGRFAGEFRAPVEPGIYRVAVADGHHRGEVAIVVADDAWRRSRMKRDHMAWVSTRGGAVVRSAEPADVRQAVDALVKPGREATRAWPMRSGWWIVLFSVTTGGEWWLRRRRDLR
jgi:hypothetical protein